MSQGVRVASGSPPTAVLTRLSLTIRFLVATVASTLHVFHRAHDSLVLLDYRGLIDGLTERCRSEAIARATEWMEGPVYDRMPITLPAGRTEDRHGGGASNRRSHRLHSTGCRVLALMGGEVS